MLSSSPDREDLVDDNERFLFWVMVVVSVLLYYLLVRVALAGGEKTSVFLGYLVGFMLLTFVMHAYTMGHIRGNGVRVSARQFPLLQRLVEAHAAKLGMESVPEVYVMESGGVLNAFAARLFGGRFIIVYSDVLALAQRQGEAAVGFIVGHELGHHWRGHLTWHLLLTPGRFVPYLGPAYSRACEYTCDRVGAWCQPDGAIDGLVVLAAGGWLHKQVDVDEFAEQAKTDRGFWIRRAEIISSHPRLPKRVAALLERGAPKPGSSPAAGL